MVAYSRELGDEVLARYATGEALRAICAEKGIPNRKTVYLWALRNDDGFGDRFREAGEMRAHALVDDLTEISDDARNDWMANNDPENTGFKLNGENIQRSKLRTDTRRWIAARLLPRVYGDRLSTQNLDRDGNPADPVMPVLNVTVARE
jgi:hypothetical protein